jgi:DNA-directed RNA polymerase subunit RPC12/RpoP
MANLQGECPKCGKRVLHVNVEQIVGMVDGSSKARCLSYSCIHCNTILGVQIDPRSKPRLRSSRTPAAS